MSLPRISVVVPSYNQGHYLRATLDSVLGQRYPSLELIVVDGGSQDDSKAILQAYGSQLDWWVSEPDGGQTPALIKGFARATGEILCWLNSDDLFEPWTLAEVGEWFAHHPSAEVVYGDTLWIDAQGRALRPQREIPLNRFIWLHTYNYIPGMSTFWRRGIYDAVGGLDASFNVCMDGDLWMRMAERTKLHHVRRSWSRMRWYPSQKCRRLAATLEAEHLRICTRYWQTERPPLLRARKQLARAMRIAWKAATGCYPPGYVHDLSELER